jgi:hypothetical protein
MTPQISNALTLRITAAVFATGLSWGQAGDAERGKRSLKEQASA